MYQGHSRLASQCKDPFCELSHDPDPGVSGVEVKGGLDLPRAEGEMPTEPGFYYNDGAQGIMMYHLDGSGRWHVSYHYGTGPGEWMACAWGYIEQTIGVYPLKKV